MQFVLTRLHAVNHQILARHVHNEDFQQGRVRRKSDDHHSEYRNTIIEPLERLSPRPAFAEPAELCSSYGRALTTPWPASACALRALPCTAANVWASIYFAVKIEVPM